MAGLQGRVAFITGAAQGIGYACCQALGRAGARLVISDIDAAALERAKASLEGENIEVTAHACDVEDKSQVEAAVQAAVDAFGQLDIAVANAGIVRSNDFLDYSESDWDDVIRVNLKGVFLTGQVAAKHMVAAGKGGSIVNISSVNAVTAIPSIVAYNASKGGINNLTRCMAVSLAKYNIRVNAVGPGSVMTDMLRQVARDKAKMTSLLSRTPMLRAADPIEIGNVVKFLAGSDSSYITGQILYADGGRLALNYTVEVPDEALHVSE